MILQIQATNEINALIDDCVKLNRSHGPRSAQVLWHTGIAEIQVDHNISTIDIKNILSPAMGNHPFINEYYTQL